MAQLSHPLLRYLSSEVYETVGSSPARYTVLIDAVAGIADPAAILFLVIGFIQTIMVRRADEKKIRILESLLPFCCYCRKYRTKEEVWLPLESLLERHVSRFIYGICPDCVVSMLKQAPLRGGHEKKAL